ncbi:S-adenosylmethionine:tRNA ribosyltransferase-isomerase [Euzebya tangerina]|uniref:S-adenosylmethionine:tRNA ribosyltransferase-isomerase n=1 Tax=Euzebya tangerina TaxID=591198 RepID=UPI000E31B756|nr:S-adenosylmethionine:tRNA ribosyltransferase-isomerase [Euzebya tangerina]
MTGLTTVPACVSPQFHMRDRDDTQAEVRSIQTVEGPTLPRPSTRFSLDPARHASTPPEERGLERDQVGLMIASQDESGVAQLRHTRFSQLGEGLEAGDLLVVNTSPTLPAAIAGTWLPRPTGGMQRVTSGPGSARSYPVVVHVAGPSRGRGWVVELRHPDQSGPVLQAQVGDTVRLTGGAEVSLRHPVAAGPPPDTTRRTDRPGGEPHLAGGEPHSAGDEPNLAGDEPNLAGGEPHVAGVRLWRAEVHVGADRSRASLAAHLHSHGRPITYSPDPPAHLGAYQTVFARPAPTDPGGFPGPWGSAEMTSAARPFSHELVTRLVVQGIQIAPIVLHTGVSSQTAGEAPQPEWFEVPEVTASLVNHARSGGHRVVAVGTTVTRALESAATGEGELAAASGWTDLVITPQRGVKIVSGLVTGWHESDASHLLLLEAVAGPGLVGAAYQAAVAGPYLWHEFGDSCLLLP